MNLDERGRNRGRVGGGGWGWVGMGGRQSINNPLINFYNECILLSSVVQFTSTISLLFTTDVNK